MKSITDNVIILDEKEEGTIYQTIKDHRNTIKKESRETNNYSKHIILFLSSNMVPYLSRKSIRRALTRLSRYCKYIVFYNCTQF